MTSILKTPSLIFKFLLILGLLVSAPNLLAQEDSSLDNFEDEDDFFFFEEQETDSEEIADLFEAINRITFAFNDRLFRVILSPVLKGYRVVPVPVRVSISNFYTNLTAPVSSVNALLQMDVNNSMSELGRFIINSTVGILGFFDPATKFGLQRDREDFGQTLGHYGVGHGFYVVVPFLGFSSFRDLGGRVINSQLNPIQGIWDPELDDWIAYQSLDAINDLSFDADNYFSLYDSALDPYVFFRSSYLQLRTAVVNK